MKLAIVTTHPIQYNAPWFRLLSNEPNIDVMVYYTWEQSNQPAKFDPGFGKIIQWDIPLTEGYEYTFVKNTSKNPGSHHYSGIVNPTLNGEIEDWGADAVLVFGWPFKSHLACIKYFKGKIPVLFRGDSTLLNENRGIKKILRRLFLTYIYSFIDYALYVGTNNKEYFKAHGLKDNQLVFVPHAIDNNRFADNAITYQNEADAWRIELGIKEDHFVIVYAGKFDKVKNPWYIVNLAKELKAEHYRFLLVGNGPLEEEIKSVANNDSRIIFIDFQNQKKMPVVYRLANVILLSSVSETWGLAINEAMACNIPVITNDKVGASVDLIENGINGIVTRQGDFVSAMAYIEKLQTDLTIHAEIAKTNESLLIIYSFNNIVKNITKLINSFKVKTS